MDCSCRGRAGLGQEPWGSTHGLPHASPSLLRLQHRDHTAAPPGVCCCMGWGPCPTATSHQARRYLEELGRLLLQLLHLPLVLAGVERGGGRGAGALAVGPRAHRLHRVEVLHPRAAGPDAAAGVLAERPQDALAAAVGALRGHPHLVRLTQRLQGTVPGVPWGHPPPPSLPPAATPGSAGFSPPQGLLAVPWEHGAWRSPTTLSLLSAPG